MFNRRIILISVCNFTIEESLSYELTSVPMSLSDVNQRMRKAIKAQFGAFLKEGSEIMLTTSNSNTRRVTDGGWFLHQVKKWSLQLEWRTRTLPKRLWIKFQRIGRVWLDLIDMIYAQLKTMNMHAENDIFCWYTDQRQHGMHDKQGEIPAQSTQQSSVYQVIGASTT